MSCFQVRTDLALEARESIGKAQEELRGITVEEYDREEIQVHITRVVISSKNGARAMNKPMGNYITLEAPAMQEADEDYHREISRELANQIKSILPGSDREQSILVVGLGNRAITPDAIGPQAADKTLVTRHLISLSPEHFGSFRSVAALAAGVLGTTGVESGEIVKAVADKITPRAIIAVDALAARRVERLCATVQVCDSGIAPGSGVGNHRFALNAETMGVPVIAVGVPTVVDGATLCADLLEEAGQHPDPQAISQAPGATLMVTPRDIDQRVEDMAKVIGYALSLSLQPALDLESLQALIE